MTPNSSFDSLLHPFIICMDSELSILLIGLQSDQMTMLYEVLFPQYFSHSTFPYRYINLANNIYLSQI